MERVSTGTFVALALSAALGYAAPQPRRVPADTETLTGCVETGPSRTYMLAAGAPGSSEDTRYELVDDGSADLSQLVGQKVTVSGQRAADPDANPSADVTSAPRFTVQSVLPAGSSC